MIANLLSTSAIISNIRFYYFHLVSFIRVDSADVHWRHSILHQTLEYRYYYNYFNPHKFSTPAFACGLSVWWNLCDGKFPQVFKNRFSILAINAIIWMVFQFFQSSFQAFGGRSNGTNYNWCHRYPQVL